MRPAPLSQVPDRIILDAGAYELTIENVEEALSKTDKLMYKAELRVAGPNGVPGIGMPQFENFVIGTDEDLNADDPNTWLKSRGASRLKQLLKAAQVEIGDDVDECIAQALGQSIVARIIAFTEPDLNRDKTPNEYAGQPRNRIASFHPLGAVETGLAPEAPETARQPARPPARPPAARPAAPAPLPPRRAVPPRTTTAPRVGTQPTPATAPTPPPPTAKPPARKPAADAKAPKDRIVACGNCNQEMYESQFEAHMDQCLPQE